jgi:thioredoxin-related protein
MIMSRILLILLVLAMGVEGAVFVAPVRAGSDAFFNATTDNLQRLLVQAQQERKGILVLFEMAGCGECRKVKETILRDPAVQDYYRQHFLNTSLDLSSFAPLTDFKGDAITPTLLALNHRVQASPTFMFFDASGQPVTRFTGSIQDSAEFLQLGRYVVDAAYETASFRAYQRQAGGQ